MVKFSIIVPVYNTENYIRECVDSILTQSFSNYEVLLVDDGSMDSSGRICDEYAQLNKKIRVFHQENKGQSSARNLALLEAKGEYCVFVDSDDVLDENGLTILNECLGNYDSIDVMVTRISYIEYPLNVKKECSYNFLQAECNRIGKNEILNFLNQYKDFMYAPWAFVVKREYVFKQQLFFKEGILHEDEEWIPRVLLNTNRIGFCNYSTYCYRVDRPGSVVTVLNIKRMMDKLVVVDYLAEDFPAEYYTGEILLQVMCRRQKIVFGVLCDLMLYKDYDGYEKLEENIKGKLSLLKMSNYIPHVLAYYSAKIIGVKNTSRLLRVIKKYM